MPDNAFPDPIVHRRNSNCKNVLHRQQAWHGVLDVPQFTLGKFNMARYENGNLHQFISEHHFCFPELCESVTSSFTYYSWPENGISASFLWNRLQRCKSFILGYGNKFYTKHLTRIFDDPCICPVWSVFRTKKSLMSFSFP